MNSAHAKIVITGATGAIGGCVVEACERAFAGAELSLLSRRDGLGAGRHRHIQMDLAAEGAKSGSKLRGALEGADAVVHLAASVKWAATYAEAYEANVHATQTLVRGVEAFAPRSCRFIHVSTAYASGCQRSFLTNPIEYDGLIFANNYEYTKHLSEQVVCDSDLRWTILQPSLVVGNQKNGHIGRQNGMYRVMDTLARGLVPALPVAGDALIDVVPVDFLADVIIATIENEEFVKMRVPVVSGGKSMSAVTLITMIFASINRHRFGFGLQQIEPVKMVEPERFHRFFLPLMMEMARPSLKALIAATKEYYSYFCVTSAFTSGPFPPPDPESYMQLIVDTWCRENKQSIRSTPVDWEFLLSPT